MSKKRIAFDIILFICWLYGMSVLVQNGSMPIWALILIVVMIVR